MEPTFVISMFNVHLLLVLDTEIDRAPYDLHGDYIILYFRKSPTMSTASHNSNESMPDESMEVKFKRISVIVQNIILSSGDWT